MSYLDIEQKERKRKELLDLIEKSKPTLSQAFHEASINPGTQPVDDVFILYYF